MLIEKGDIIKLKEENSPCNGCVGKVIDVEVDCHNYTYYRITPMDSALKCKSSTCRIGTTNKFKIISKKNLYYKMKVRRK